MPSPPARLRIFLSSTAEDLTEHRDRVTEAIERLGQTTTRMETLRALLGAPLDECRNLAAEADALVVCVGHGYGWVPTIDEGGDGEKSITWWEVDGTLGAGEPVFAFLIDGEEGDRVVGLPPEPPLTGSRVRLALMAGNLGQVPALFDQRLAKVAKGG